MYLVSETLTQLTRGLASLVGKSLHSYTKTLHIELKASCSEMLPTL